MKHCAFLQTAHTLHAGKKKKKTLAPLGVGQHFQVCIKKLKIHKI